MHDQPFSTQSAASARGPAGPAAYVHALARLAECDPCLGEVETLSPWAADSGAAFYAHALMTGEQAVAACHEFSEILETRGDHVVAGLFRQLAVAEMERTDELARRTDGLALPRLPRWQYHWLYKAPPDPSLQELVAQLLTGHAALRIALNAGLRSKAIYEWVSASAADPEVRAGARELAAEKSQHVHWLRGALATLAAPLVWQEDFNGLCPAQ